MIHFILTQFQSKFPSAQCDQSQLLYDFSATFVPNQPSCQNHRHRRDLRTKLYLPDVFIGYYCVHVETEFSVYCTHPIKVIHFLYVNTRFSAFHYNDDKNWKTYGTCFLPRMTSLNHLRQFFKYEPSKGVHRRCQNMNKT